MGSAGQAWLTPVPADPEAPGLNTVPSPLGTTVVQSSFTQQEKKTITSMPILKHIFLTLTLDFLQFPVLKVKTSKLKK